MNKVEIEIDSQHPYASKMGCLRFAGCVGGADFFFSIVNSENVAIKRQSRPYTVALASVANCLSSTERATENVRMGWS
jgi:hypothetical protein